MHKRLQTAWERTQWFREARFGMFLHWGLYCIQARGEFMFGNPDYSREQYDAYFREFDPVFYDPREWARIAKAAGMKYAVLTAKHQDGFCLFDSKHTDFKSTNTRCGRDLVREFLEAFRAEGLRVGLYYSIIDCHHSDYPDDSDPKNPTLAKYLDYMHAQIEELCTDYGKLDILWLDYAYDKMVGEVWRASELIEKIRRLQPEILIDNRLECGGDGFGSLITDEPSPYCGDFISPEQIIPPLEEGLRTKQGDAVPWESCMTSNNNWGYVQFDHEYKSGPTIIKKLVECVSKGGNMLLNLGPTARGELPRPSVEALEQVGRWMHDNGKGIYGCAASGLPRPEFGRYTRRGNCIYAHVMEPPVGPVCLRGIRPDQVKKARLISNGAELLFAESWATKLYPDCAFVSLGPDPLASYAPPDPIDTVIEIELK